MFQQNTRLNKKQTAGNIKLTSPSTNCVKSKEASSKHGQSKSHERRKEGRKDERDFEGRQRRTLGPEKSHV